MGDGWIDVNEWMDGNGGMDGMDRWEWGNGWLFGEMGMGRWMDRCDTSSFVARCRAFKSVSGAGQKAHRKGQHLPVRTSDGHMQPSMWGSPYVMQDGGLHMPHTLAGYVGKGWVSEANPAP